MIYVCRVRARTNPPAKQLQTVIALDTGLDTTGCIILLQFCPRLTKVIQTTEQTNKQTKEQTK